MKWPVISVGSLSSGGAGKTPFLMALAGLLRELGYAPDVLSRGYGRRTLGILQVDPNGSAETFGDEPLLLAQTLRCPVFVGADRFAAGTLAEARLSDAERRVHLLDDGFAHRRLARDIDIVLVTMAELHDCLLPAGNLRESWPSLRRAHVIVLRDDEADELRPALRRVLGPEPAIAVWTISRTPALPASLPPRPFVFCGIARPADFEAGLRAQSIHPTAMRAFRDHQRYRLADVRQLATQARRAHADGFLTTSKDAVKLTPELRTILQQVGPLAVADLVIDVHHRDTCADDLRGLLVSPSKPSAPPS